MPSQREIRRRIGSAQNIKQITRAMQFVAASKLRRAQESTLAARPYREKLDEVIADLAAVLSDADHPLLAERDFDADHKRLIILMTSDRGLAGALNTNTVRFVAREITEHQGDLKVVPVGPQGPRRDAPRPGPRSPPTSRAWASGRRSPTCCRSPASSPTTSSPASTTGSTSSTPGSCPPSSSGRSWSSCSRSSRPEDTEGIPGHQFLFEPDPAGVPRGAPAALRGDPPVRSRSWRRPPASSAARWSR